MTTETATAGHPGAAPVEVRSIDQIPLDERHGRVRDQFTLWFGLNANIFVVVLGGVTVFLGLNLLWSTIAVVVGVLIGLTLVGFHAIQGPTSGWCTWYSWRACPGRGRRCTASSANVVSAAAQPSSYSSTGTSEIDRRRRR